MGGVAGRGLKGFASLGSEGGEDWTVVAEQTESVDQANLLDDEG